jgi:hypothetical protein
MATGREMLRGVYPERSEGLSMTIPVLVVKIHYCASKAERGMFDDLASPRAINRAATPLLSFYISFLKEERLAMFIHR